MNNIQLIPTRLSDVILFYNTRFNPFALKYSKIKTIPTISEHIKWFKNNYKNGFYTILEKNIPVGYIRVDIKNTISIAILPQHTQKGIATESLKLILKIYENLNAEIYQKNKASLRLFNKFSEIKLNIII